MSALVTPVFFLHHCFSDIIKNRGDEWTALFLNYSVFLCDLNFLGQAVQESQGIGFRVNVIPDMVSIFRRVSANSFYVDRTIASN